MKDSGYGGLFIFTLGISSIPMFFVVRYFESINAFDSIGVGYTIYVAVLFSLTPALLVCGAKWFKSKW